MATCKECLHVELCEALEQGNGLMKVSPIHCGYYKPAADVAPKSEVEKITGKYEDLKLKYADLQKDHDELVAWGGHINSAEKAAVARAIFEEIENTISPMLGLEDDKEYVAILGTTFAELKKKYTEERTD